MSYKSLLALPLVGAVVLFLTGSVLADPLPPPVPEQPRTHTLTIINGDHVMQRTFVWQNGLWRTCGDANSCDSPRRAEEVACSLKAKGKQTSVGHHCP